MADPFGSAPGSDTDTAPKQKPNPKGEAQSGKPSAPQRTALGADGPDNPKGLNILTQKGRETQRQEWEAYEIFHEMHPEAHVVETPKEQPALVDGIIRTGTGIVGVVETKCRMMTHDKLMGDFDGEWLITHRKIDEAREAAATVLGVPLFGLLYLVKDNRTLLWKISDREGNWLFDFDTRKTFTQKNVNSGSSRSARRLNAFLPADFIVEDSEGENLGAALW